MSLDISSVRTALSLRLSDPSNLIWSSSALDEAIRESLNDISNLYPSPLLIDGLDDASETTLSVFDYNPLLCGAEAYAVQFRVNGKYEDAVIDEIESAHLESWAKSRMDLFLNYLDLIRKRNFHQASDPPYSQWDWEEE